MTVTGTGTKVQLSVQLQYSGSDDQDSLVLAPPPQHTLSHTHARMCPRTLVRMLVCTRQTFSALNCIKPWRIWKIRSARFWVWHSTHPRILLAPHISGTHRTLVPLCSERIPATENKVLFWVDTAFFMHIGQLRTMTCTFPNNFYCFV